MNNINMEYTHSKHADMLASIFYMAERPRKADADFFGRLPCDLHENMGAGDTSLSSKPKEKGERPKLFTLISLFGLILKWQYHPKRLFPPDGRKCGSTTSSGCRSNGRFPLRRPGISSKYQND